MKREEAEKGAKKQREWEEIGEKRREMEKRRQERDKRHEWEDMEWKRKRRRSG